MLSNSWIGGITVIVVVGNAGAAPTTLQRLELVPGSSSSSQNIMGVSADGSTVVGWSGNRAAVWRSDGTGRFLSSFPGEIGSQANAVNSDGSIIVGISATSTGHRACMWTNGVGRLLPVIGVATQSQCWAVSEDGRAAAGHVTSATTGSTRFAARWAEGVGGGYANSVAPTGGWTSEAWAMNSAGTVIAGEQSGRAFRWIAGLGTQLLPDGGQLGGDRVWGMNSSGTVLVGQAGFAMARWVGDSEPEILADQYSGIYAYSCSADGNVIVGGRSGSAEAAIIWTPGTGVVLLRELLQARGFDVGLIDLGSGVGVTADGRTFVGASSLSAGRGFILHLGDCPADMNADLIVDFFDYLDYVQAFAVGDVAADRDGDGVVDLFDYLDFLEAFSVGCE